MDELNVSQLLLKTRDFALDELLWENVRLPDRVRTSIGGVQSSNITIRIRNANNRTCVQRIHAKVMLICVRIGASLVLLKVLPNPPIYCTCFLRRVSRLLRRQFTRSCSAFHPDSSKPQFTLHSPGFAPYDTGITTRDPKFPTHDSEFTPYDPGFTTHYPWFTF